jgi:hypothetical protein
MRQKKIWLTLLTAVVLTAACTPRNTPSSRKTTTADTVLTQAFIHRYGQHYKKIPCQVMSIDLYSEGLTRGEGDTLRGTGTNLYFSDVFLDTQAAILPAAEYRLDTTAAPGTALPAREYEGLVTGTTLVQVQDGSTVSISMFESGGFRLHYEGDTAVMEIHLETSDRRHYDGTYRGVPHYEP